MPLRKLSEVTLATTASSLETASAAPTSVASSSTSSAAAYERYAVKCVGSLFKLPQNKHSVNTIEEACQMTNKREGKKHLPSSQYRQCLGLPYEQQQMLPDLKKAGQ